MNPDKLKKRLYQIPATPYRDIGAVKDYHRRESNYIILEEKSSTEFDSDDFFDLDKEIDVARPARDLVAKSFEKYDSQQDIQPIELNKIETVELSKEKVIEIIASPNPNNFNPIILNKSLKEEGHEYMQCTFEKSDGGRCKRQSLKSIDVCAIHKKYLERNAQ